MHSRFMALIFAVAILGAAGFVSSSGRAMQGGTASPQASPAAILATGAAFLTIVNRGAETDRLISVKSDIAATAEIHETADNAGLMGMRPLQNGLEIPAGATVSLAPNSYHIMLVGLTRDITNGATLALTLTFERAGEITVPVNVRFRAEPANGESRTETVTAGDLTIEDVWSRPAPA